MPFPITIFAVIYYQIDVRQGEIETTGPLGPVASTKLRPREGDNGYDESPFDFDPRRRPLGIAAALGGGALLASPAHAASSFNFNLVRNPGLPAGCATKAKASVKLSSVGFAEKLTITVSGLAPNTGLDLFVIQVPGAPFGISWYLGDLDADGTGKVTKTFVSRLSIETFAVAPGAAPAPVTFKGDANKNPKFAPVQTYHLGCLVQLARGRGDTVNQ